MFDRASDAYRATLRVADTEARGLGASAIEPEHILLGLMQAEEAVAKVLRSCGLELDSVRRFLGSEEPSTRALPFSTSAQRAVERSLRKALERESLYLEPKHLLFACLDDDHGAVEAILHAFGTSSDAVRLMIELSDRNEGISPEEARVGTMVARLFGPLAVEQPGGP